MAGLVPAISRDKALPPERDRRNKSSDDTDEKV